MISVDMSSSSWSSFVLPNMLLIKPLLTPSQLFPLRYPALQFPAASPTTAELCLGPTFPCCGPAGAPWQKALSNTGLITYASCISRVQGLRFLSIAWKQLPPVFLSSFIAVLWWEASLASPTLSHVELGCPILCSSISFLIFHLIICSHYFV